MYFLKGTPFIYQGQEIGMTNMQVNSIDEFVDIESKNVINTMKSLHLPKKYIDKSIRNGSRDNSRIPMQWDDSVYAGFSEVEPWLKVNENKSFINVEESKKDPNSIFNYYKKLIQIHKDEVLVKEGVYKDLLPNSNKLFAYERMGENELLLVISNFTSKEIKCKILKKYQEYKVEVLLNNYDNVFDKLQPYQTILYKLTK
jgi:glycosidase